DRSRGLFSRTRVVLPIPLISIDCVRQSSALLSAIEMEESAHNFFARYVGPIALARELRVYPTPGRRMAQVGDTARSGRRVNQASLIFMSLSLHKATFFGPAAT